MNVRFLIDALTQQTTVLIAQLATTGGVRAPLAHIANQVFLELATELNAQGVSRKVAADMFGMALRSYHAKLRRLEVSASDPVQRSIWESIYDYIDANGPVAQADVMMRFRHDPEDVVRGVLFDMVENGLVYQSGAQEQRVYRCVPDSELRQRTDDHQSASLYWAVWMVVYRNGPLTREDLATQIKQDDSSVSAALDTLLEEGHIERDAGGAYMSRDIFVPLGEPAGWEAALFDHYSAMTTAMVTKLRETRLKTLPSDEVGGSTYTFDVWAGHPLRDEVRSQLRRIRGELSELNARVREHNAAVEAPDDLEEVIVYCGQTVVRQGDAI